MLIIKKLNKTFSAILAVCILLTLIPINNVKASSSIDVDINNGNVIKIEDIGENDISENKTFNDVENLLQSVETEPLNSEKNIDSNNSIQPYAASENHNISIKVQQIILDSSLNLGYTYGTSKTITVPCIQSHTSGYNHNIYIKYCHPSALGWEQTDWIGWQHGTYYSHKAESYYTGTWAPFNSYGSTTIAAVANMTGSQPYKSSKLVYLVYKKVADTPSKTFTVTYTDGVAGETLFPDQGYEGLKEGDDTPAFVGNPSRDGYTFMGWSPSINPKVLEDDSNSNGEIIYTATWQKNGPTLVNITLRKRFEGIDTTQIPSNFYLEYYYENLETPKGTLKLKDAEKINDNLYQWKVDLPIETDVTFKEYNYQVDKYEYIGIDGNQNVIKKDHNIPEITFKFSEDKCVHTNVEYTDNGDETHDGVCENCGRTVVNNESHIDTNKDKMCDKCGSYTEIVGGNASTTVTIPAITTITNYYNYAVITVPYRVEYYDQKGNTIKETSYRTGIEGETATPIDNDYNIDGWIFDDTDSRNILSKELKESEENVLKLYFYKPVVNLHFVKDINEDNESFERMQLKKDDSYKFQVALTNQKTENIIQGILDSKNGLVINDIPIGTYVIEETDDMYFDFVDMEALNSIEGISFEKIDNKYILTITDSAIKERILEIRVNNKIESDRPYEDKEEKENLFSWKDESTGPTTYVVHWYDSDGNEIKTPETRPGTVGTTAYVTSEDKNVPGYEYNESNPLNIENKVLSKDESNELKLYFTSTLQIANHLTITKTPSEEYPYVGNTFYYTIHIKNDNPTAQKVKIVDSLNSKLKFISCSDDGIYDIDTHTVTWTNIDIPANESKNIILSVEALDSGEIYNEAKLFYNKFSTSGNTTVTARENTKN